MELIYAYLIGSNLRLIQSAIDQKFTIKTPISYMKALKEVCNHLKSIGFTKKNLDEINKFISSWEKKYYPNEKIDYDIDVNLINSNMPIEEKDFYELDNNLKIWTDRIREEISTIEIIKLQSTGNLDSKKLFAGLKEFIEKDILEKIPEIVINDLNDCIKCLQIGSWTPAGMVAMRAIEFAVRKYYENITTNSSENKSWHEILEELKKNQNSDKTLIKYLDYLKDIRNSIQHPDQSLNVFDAEITFLHAVKIFKMIFKV